MTISQVQEQQKRNMIVTLKKSQYGILPVVFCKATPGDLVLGTSKRPP